MELQRLETSGTIDVQLGVAFPLHGKRMLAVYHQNIAGGVWQIVTSLED
jgi:hypothetical protein